MMLRNLPFAHGHATLVCPFYPPIRPGMRRYRPQIAVCLAHLITHTADHEVSSDISVDEPCQATFFDRAAFLPWAIERLGPLELHRLKAASPLATWQQQSEMLDTLRRLGVISEGQALGLARDLQRRLLRPASETARATVDHRAVTTSRIRGEDASPPATGAPLCPSSEEAGHRASSRPAAPPRRAARPVKSATTNKATSSSCRRTQRTSRKNHSPTEHTRMPRKRTGEIYSIFGQIEAAAAEFLIKKGELIRIPADRIPPSAALNVQGQCALFAVIVPACKLARFEQLIADLRA